MRKIYEYRIAISYVCETPQHAYLVSHTQFRILYDALFYLKPVGQLVVALIGCSNLA